jgi:hypothetical protein
MWLSLPLGQLAELARRPALGRDRLAPGFVESPSAYVQPPLKDRTPRHATPRPDPGFGARLPVSSHPGPNIASPNPAPDSVLHGRHASPTIRLRTFGPWLANECFRRRRRRPDSGLRRPSRMTATAKSHVSRHHGPHDPGLRSPRAARHCFGDSPDVHRLRRRTGCSDVSVISRYRPR